MQKTIEESSLAELIAVCMSKCRDEQNTRENSLVATKLQEAMMWHNEHQKNLLGAARRSGVGFNPNARTQVMPEPFVDAPPTQPPPTPEAPVGQNT